MKMERKLKNGFEMAWSLLVTSHMFLLRLFGGLICFVEKTRDVLYDWCLYISIIHFVIHHKN